MTHPLTEKMIEEMSHLVEMAPWYEKYPDDYDYDCLVEGMRAAYDLGEDKGRAVMLEQVIDWIEEYLTAGDVIAEDLKKAMCPQNEENN